MTATSKRPRTDSLGLALEQERKAPAHERVGRLRGREAGEKVARERDVVRGLAAAFADADREPVGARLLGDGRHVDGCGRHFAEDRPSSAARSA